MAVMGTLNCSAIMENPEILNVSAHLEEWEHESQSFPDGMNIKCSDTSHAVTFDWFLGRKKCCYNRQMAQW